MSNLVDIHLQLREPINCLDIDGLVGSLATAHIMQILPQVIELGGESQKGGQSHGLFAQSDLLFRIQF